MTGYDWFEALKKERADVARKDRIAVIEECALLIEDYSEPCTPEELAAAIRALKDKPWVA